MSETDRPMIAWRKSSHSGGQGGQCVEVAALSTTVGVRDSKNPALGHMALRARAFAELAASIKSGTLDRG